MRPDDEIADALRGEVLRCAGRAADLASILESIGEQALVAVEDIRGRADADELARRSHAIRGVVVNALLVLAELQHVAGRLDALAAMRATEATEA